MQYFVHFLSPGSAETDSGRGGKLNSHLMASCIRNILTKTYCNWIALLQVMTKKFWCVFYASQCSCHFFYIFQSVVVAATYILSTSVMPSNAVAGLFGILQSMEITVARPAF